MTEVALSFPSFKTANRSPNSAERAPWITAATPFYAESGGQAGDTGRIQWPGGSFRVTDTRKAPGGLHLHVGMTESGDLKSGQDVELFVDGWTARLHPLEPQC